MNLSFVTLSDLSRYLVYENGDVFDKKLNRFITFQENKDGYLKVTLTLDCGKRKTFSVHRLVASGFIPNQDNKETVNHKDGIKNNNDVSNLEWATRSEQVKHAWDNSLIKDLESRKNSLIQALGKKVECLETGEIFDSIGEACRAKKIKKSNLSKHLLGYKGYKSVGGLTWRYKND